MQLSKVHVDFLAVDIIGGSFLVKAVAVQVRNVLKAIPRIPSRHSFPTLQFQELLFIFTGCIPPRILLLGRVVSFDDVYELKRILQ
jgi:hypothetical protein